MSAAKERIDDLQRRGCRIIQRPDLFCFGMDAVLLAAWAAAGRGDRVLDLCSGNGIVPILMDARLPEEVRGEGSVHFTGIEISSICVDMARRSAQMQKLLPPRFLQRRKSAPKKCWKKCWEKSKLTAR